MAACSCIAIRYRQALPAPARRVEQWGFRRDRPRCVVCTSRWANLYIYTLVPDFSGRLLLLLLLCLVSRYHCTVPCLYFVLLGIVTTCQCVGKKQLRSLTPKSYTNLLPMAEKKWKNLPWQRRFLLQCWMLNGSAFWVSDVQTCLCRCSSFSLCGSKRFMKVETAESSPHQIRSWYITSFKFHLGNSTFIHCFGLSPLDRESLFVNCFWLV